MDQIDAMQTLNAKDLDIVQVLTGVLEQAIAQLLQTPHVLSMKLTMHMDQIDAYQTLNAKDLDIVQVLTGVQVQAIAQLLQHNLNIV